METIIREIITKAVTDIETETRGQESLTGNEFLKALFAKLFPESYVEVVKTEPAPAEAVAEVPVVPATPEKEKKPRKPRAKKDAEPVAEPVAEAEAPTTPEQPAHAEAQAPPPAPKKPRAKKEKGPVNLDKLTPTQTKQLKKLAEEAKVEADKKDMLAYVNEMTPEDYNAKSLDDHMKAFIQSRTGGVAAPEPQPQPEKEKELDCLEVEFEGRTYYIDSNTRRVYKEEEGVHKFAGYVGMGSLAGLKMPEEEDM